MRWPPSVGRSPGELTLRRFEVMRTADQVEIRFDDGGMNLLSSAALEELEAVISEIPPSATFLTFRSGRRGIFAAGADIAEMSTFSAGQADRFAALGQRVFAAIERLPLVTVVMIDGDCFGGAVDLTLAFDRRLATERSRFSHPGSRLGIITGFGGTGRWRGRLERVTAAQLFLSNVVLNAEEASAAGLVDAIVDDPSVSIALKLPAPARVRLLKRLSSCSGMSASQLLRMARHLEEFRTVSEQELAWN